MKSTFIALLALCFCLGGCGEKTQSEIVEEAIRESLKKPTGELTKADFEKVTRLELSENQLTELPKDLENLTQLEELNLYDNQLTDVRGLKKLTQLTSMQLHYNQLTEVKGLEKLTKLKSLFLNSNKLTEVTGLEKLTKLEVLGLSDNQLTEVKGLEKLTQLTGLNLKNNPDLTEAQIDELQKALPNCRIISNPTK